MIKTELLQDGALIRHYSDKGFTLRQIETGMEYDDAVDVVPCVYTYEETDKLIGNGEATEADYLSALEKLGVSE